MNLLMRCDGNGEVALVHLQYDCAGDRFHIAELVPGSDELVHRRVNHEVFCVGDYPELDGVIHLSATAGWAWDMEAVNDLVVGYLNRQSKARVRLHPAWEAELSLGQV